MLLCTDYDVHAEIREARGIPLRECGWGVSHTYSYILSSQLPLYKNKISLIVVISNMTNKGMVTRLTFKLLVSLESHFDERPCYMIIS